MGYKVFKYGWIITITIICILISLCIPVYTYITHQVVPFHYGLVLFVTMAFAIWSTYIAHGDDKKKALPYCCEYTFLGKILSFLLGDRRGIAVLVLLSLIVGGLTVNQIISYDASILAVGIVWYLMAFYYAKEIPSKKAKVFGMIIAIVVATLAWTLFSYMSYYSGVRSVLYQNQMGLFHAVKAVLVSDLPADSKLEKIENIASTTGGEFTVYKDGQPLFYKKSYRDIRIYKLESIYSKFEQEEFRLFNYDGSTYELEYKYANQPYYFWGMVRAITFSIFPDVAYGYSLDGYTYYKAQKYARSTQFWGVFWVFYCIALALQFYRLEDKRINKALNDLNQDLNNLNQDLNNLNQDLNDLNEELNNVNQELKDANHQLQIAYSAYDHMHDEFDKVALRDTKQELQKIQLSWSEIVRNILADSRHSLKNKLQDQPLLTEEERNQFDAHDKELIGEIEERMNAQLSVFRTTILEHQKELFKTLDYKLKLESIGTIIEYINGKIPNNYRDKRRSGIIFTINDGIAEPCKQQFCEINLNRLYSIVENLLKNSSNALANKSIDDDLDDRITLSYDIEDTGDGRCFAIRVTDNGGGFKDDIIEKIYKVPVASSDRTTQRDGKGSQYVKFFSDRMKAQINVGNIINEYKEIGAEVKLLIPIANGEKA